MENAYHTYLVYCLKQFGLHAKAMENHLNILKGGGCDIRVSMKGSCGCTSGEKDLTANKTRAGHQIVSAVIRERSYGDLNSNKDSADGKKWTELIEI